MPPHHPRHPTRRARDADAAWDALTASGVADKRHLPGWIAEIGEIIAAPALLPATPTDDEKP